MPKFPPIPQLSIIVPVGQDVPAFEQTLVSVLENRPHECEVIVPHDGRYDDPFNLGDETRLVVAEDGNLVDLAMAGTRAARAPFVHVLADGLRATDGWTEPALEKFEQHDAACVAPVIRHCVDGRIVAAGWSDTKSQLLHPIAAGKSQAEGDVATRSTGAYLRASFWRRSVFLSLGDSFLFDAGKNEESVSEAEYVFYQLLRGADWRSMIASECDILSDHLNMIGEVPSTERGRRLGAAKRYFDAGNAGITLGGYVKAAIGCMNHSGEFGQCYGRMTCGSHVESLQKKLRPEIVQSCTDQDSVFIKPAQETQPMRRAA